MEATQASVSAPVEVSWSPPSGGAATITGYRIFYDGRDILFMPQADIITGIDLNLGLGTKVGQVLSLRAESSISQLPSELITVTITDGLCLTTVPDTSGDCNSGAAIALGVVILLVVLIATVIVVILVFLLIR